MRKLQLRTTPSPPPPPSSSAASSSSATSSSHQQQQQQQQQLSNNDNSPSSLHHVQQNGIPRTLNNNTLINSNGGNGGSDGGVINGNGFISSSSSSLPTSTPTAPVSTSVTVQSAQQFFKNLKKAKIDLVEQMLKENINFLMIRDVDGSTALIKAASKNLVNFVDLFCKYSRDNKLGFSCLDLTNKDRYTAINIAVKKQNIQVVKILLSYGADISNTPNKDGNLPIHSASRRGFTDVISVLVNYDIKQLNIMNPLNNRTPIFMAAQHGHLKTVEWFLNQEGIDLSIKSCDYKRPIHSAASHDNLDVLKLLLEKGNENINVITTNETDKRYTPMHYCCKKGALKTAKYLLEKGSLLGIFILNAQHFYFGKKTPLYLAVHGKKDEIVELFLTYYKIINELIENTTIDSSINNTIIDRSMVLKKCETFNKFSLDLNLISKSLDEYLQQEDIQAVILDPSSENSGDSDNDNADDIQRSEEKSSSNDYKRITRSIKDVIQIAILEENQELIHLSFSIVHFDIVKVYLEYFPELLNCKSTSNGNTLINKAAHIGHLEIMKYLVSKGSNISIPNDVGNRPIHRAAYCGHAEIVRFLVEDCGERVDVFQHSTPKTKRLETSLHLAARKGWIECVRVLLLNGSDITLTTKSDNPNGRRDAIQLSKRYNQFAVYDFLEKVFQRTTRSF